MVLGLLPFYVFSRLCEASLRRFPSVFFSEHQWPLITLVIPKSP